MAEVIKLVSENTFDYACQAFIKPYEKDGNIYYAAFCPEAVIYNDKLNFTSRYIVTMLHPEHGTIQFYLRILEDTWILDNPTRDKRNEVEEYNQALFSHDYNFEIAPEIIAWCDEAISSHTM